MMLSTRPLSAWQALWLGLFQSLRHWRVLLLWWLAGILPAAWLGGRIAQAANQIFAHHPDAARIITEPDLAALADAWLAHDPIIAQLRTGLVPPLLLIALIAPWAAAIAVASLRADTPPGFVALIRSGLRGYFCQLRLYLLLAPALAIALGLSLLVLALVEVGTMQVTVYQDILPWRHAAWAFIALLLLPTLGSLEAARAALANDPNQTSALLATAQGWRLVFRRFPAWLCITLLTLGAGLFVSLALHGSASGTSPWWALAFAQASVLAIGWSRLAKLHALQRLLPKPDSGR